MNKITPFLWFNDDAEQAANFYLSIFSNNRKLNELRNNAANTAPVGSILTVELELEGQQVTFLNGGPGHPQTEAFSFTIRCEDQQEIDTYWEKLTADGGAEIACGWLKDKFGLRWQVVPQNIGELLRPPAAMRAMMSMKKLDIAALKQAASAAQSTNEA
jgi:predicted 3-demethylubiquinone-9 3-methyltransferase (glyoxalase superfamily)